MSLQSKASAVRLVLFDVDGVLTAGTVVIHADGTESKTFNIRDGIAMVWAERVGLRIGLLSARMSPTTPHRAAQLGLTIVEQGVTNKLSGYERILKSTALSDAEVAYMGDDVVDLAVLSRVGLSAAPADAVAEVRARVDWVSGVAGGRGAARDLIERVLKAQHRWKAIVAASGVAASLK